MKLDNYTVEHVTKLVANSKVTIEENEPALREAVHQYGRELIQMMFEHEAAIIATKEEITGIKLAGKKNTLSFSGLCMMRLQKEVTVSV